jgi:hypothetical protein
MHEIAVCNVCFPIKISISDAWILQGLFRSGQLLEIALNNNKRSSRRVNSSTHEFVIAIRDKS